MSCDYNLTGIDSARCPECGAAIDWTEVRRRADDASAIRPATPWDTPGVSRAAGFFRTLALASFAPQRLARGFPMVADSRSAVWYALICWALGEAAALLCILGLAFAGYLRADAINFFVWVWADLLTIPASLILAVGAEFTAAEWLSTPLGREHAVPTGERHWSALLRYHAGWMVPAIPAAKLLLTAGEPWLVGAAALALHASLGGCWFCVSVCYLAKSEGSAGMRMLKLLLLPLMVGIVSALAGACMALLACAVGLALMSPW